MLQGVAADYGDSLAARTQPAIVSEGWRAGGDAPEVRDVQWAIAEFLRPAEATWILARRRSVGRASRDPLVLTAAGRSAIIAALRTRALSPATRS